MIGSIIGGAVTALGGLFGGRAEKKRKKREDQLINQRENTLEQWYRTKTSEKFIDTAPVQSTLSLLREKNKKSSNALNNNLIKNGATDEARIGTASEMNKNYADSVSKLAAMDYNYKQAIDNQYRAEKNAINNLRMNQTTSSRSYGVPLASVASEVGSQIQLLDSMNLLKKKK